MSASDTPRKALHVHLLRRLHRVRLPAAAALIFLGLWTFGVIAAAPALCALALFSALALLDRRVNEPLLSVRPQEERPAASPAARPVASPAATPSNGGLESVLAGLPDPVIALNAAEQVVALNRHVSAIAPALLRGQLISRGVRVPEVLDVIRQARASRGPQRAAYLQRVPVERWYEVVAIPMGGAQGESTDDLVLLTFHDHTALRRIEQMRADFVANASHELRTPLAALSGFIDTLQGPAREDASARERFLAIMQTQAQRMARLIDDLLSLSRIELNAHLRPDKEIDLVGIVHEVVDGLQTLAVERAVEITIAAPSGPLRVLGERDELMRLCENLVENALKYAASGKRVEIEVSRGEAGQVNGDPNGEARIAVRDHGPGIAPEHLPRLTERFYRVDVAESRAQGGTGLGLALVKHILTRHGGRLTVESTLGRGATFTACMPLPSFSASPTKYPG
jgi:two-component system, OmpR family, phosphate regulon sensor histidine kinase PhoR